MHRATQRLTATSQGDRVRQPLPSPSKPRTTRGKGTQAARRLLELFMDAFPHLCFKQQRKGSRSADWLPWRHVEHIMLRDRLSVTLSPLGMRTRRLAESQLPVQPQGPRSP